MNRFSSVNVPVMHKQVQVGLISITQDMDKILSKLMKEKYNDINCQPFSIAAVYKSDIDKLEMKLVSITIETETETYTHLSQKEMDWLKRWFTEVRDCVGDFDYYKGNEMTPEEWAAFKEKIT